MNLEKELPLTETVYYILLALLTPSHGYSIMQEVEKLSDGKVRLAAGTMYGAIVNLQKKSWIRAVESNNSRRKVYALTDVGKQVLLADYERIKYIVKITDTMLNGGNVDEKI